MDDGDLRRGKWPNADGQATEEVVVRRSRRRVSKQPALVLDETFVVQSTGHHPLETRSAMAYWQNGKLLLARSTQSLIRTVDSVARWVGIQPEESL